MKLDKTEKCELVSNAYKNVSSLKTIKAPDDAIQMANG